MKIKVLYEDKDVLVIDKPSGILVHPDQKSEGETVLGIFSKEYPKLEIVHRLDKETSGVLILAKNKKVHEFLKNQFQKRTVKKTYIAVVNGWPKNDHGIIDKPIGRSPSDFRRRLAGRGARGEMREAITEYKVLKRFTAPCVQNFSSCALPRVRGGTLGDKNFKHTAPFTYLEIKPKTGRTHQIRVHMKYLNYPVAYDSLYNPKGVCPNGLERLALHAKSIEFENLKGKVIKVESPVPKEFEKLI
ncbi:MAG: RluA family pseudouridine synthase [bacterium]